MMVAKNISIIAPTLADSASENLILSIKISESNVSYAVFDKSKKNILAIEKWNLLNNDELFGIKETLNKIVNDSFVLKNTFQKTFVLLDNPVFTLVPDKIYSIGDMDIISILINYGINLYQLNDDQKSAISIARDNKISVVVNYLDDTDSLLRFNKKRKFNSLVSIARSFELSVEPPSKSPRYLA